MFFSGLEQYLLYLERRGELTRVKDFVDSAIGIARYVELESAKENGGNALLFENTWTAYPVAANLYPYTGRLEDAVEACRAIELEAVPEELTSLRGRMTFFLRPGRYSSYAPYQEKRHSPCHDSVQYVTRLSDLPVTLGSCHDSEGGLVSAIVCTANPLTGRLSIEIGSLRFLDDTSAVLHLDSASDAMLNLQQSSYRLPVALCLGGDPLFTVISSLHLPENTDYGRMAGLLRKKAVGFVSCMTQKLDVPSDCDFVIEGYIHKSEELYNDTLADGRQAMAPKFHASCVTHRRNAIFPYVSVGENSRDRVTLRTLLGRILLPSISALAPEIEDLFFSGEEGCVEVRIRSSYPEQFQKVASLMWGFRPTMHCKEVIVVDTATSERFSFTR